MSCGIVPKCFKISTVCPAKKVNKPKSADDYRPINMLTTLDKLLESIIKDQLVDFIETKLLLNRWQSGYRKQHSCETALNLVIANWKEQIKRAFETVDRAIMIEKLRGFGIRGASLKWFESFLQDRTQCTTVNGYTSTKIGNDIGLPQGSILSAILFIIYINDMPDVLENVSINLFADDTLLYIYGENLSQMAAEMNRNFQKLNDWLAVNKLKLNVTKTKWMAINNRNETLDDVSLHMEGVDLENVNSMKYLGVIIDNKLNMKDHVKYIGKKVARKIYLFGRLSKFFTFATKVNVYKTIIQPHFDYCATVLMCANNEDVEKLQKLQNKALRIILKCKRRTSVMEMFHRLNIWKIKTIQQSILIITLKLVFKLRNNMTPEYLSSRSKLNNQVHSRELRNANDFRLPKYTKSRSQKMVLYNGLKWFNNLPDHIKNEKDWTAFKRKICEFLSVKTVLNID